MKHVAIVTQVKKPSHYCKLPGWWVRFRNNIQTGSIVACKECHTLWTLKSWSDGVFWDQVKPEEGEAPTTKWASIEIMRDQHDRLHKVSVTHADDCVPCKEDLADIRADIEKKVPFTTAKCKTCNEWIRFWEGNFDDDGYWYHVGTVTAWTTGPNAHKAAPRIEGEL